ncbi:hypothetical protein EW146_g5180 [Bondarzewia mesenterica]|uniref:NAD(P)-binding domain-containing protein n=1 Tax=Bondarzewia mesenterica TaxID=1095465 RepID=A0A4S4LS80_9AGAM|nr:hypothetical protein EW146_g5180 [Bondarzewia mesenterica]
MSTVFFLGATGYIGGSLLVTLKKHFPNLTIHALVRSPTHIPAIRAVGAEPIQGDFGDEALIAEWSAKADIVVNAADSDDVKLITAILGGIKRRREEGKPKGLLIHTSGVAVFLDDGTEGLYDPSGRVWNDNSEEDIQSITTSMLHGSVDVLVLLVGKEGYVNTYIVSPAAIVGPSLGPVGKASFFLKGTTHIVLSRKSAVYVGEGSNVFYVVHIDDVMNLYLRVFELAVAEKEAAVSSYTRYFVASSQPAAWKTIMTLLASTLHKRGLLESPEPQSVSIGDLLPYEHFLAKSQRIVTDRSKSLGWNPRPVVLEDWFEASVDAVLEGLPR